MSEGDAATGGGEGEGPRHVAGTPIWTLPSFGSTPVRKSCASVTGASDAVTEASERAANRRHYRHRACLDPRSASVPCVRPSVRHGPTACPYRPSRPSRPFPSLAPASSRTVPPVPCVRPSRPSRPSVPSPYHPSGPTARPVPSRPVPPSVRPTRARPKASRTIAPVQGRGWSSRVRHMSYNGDDTERESLRGGPHGDTGRRHGTETWLGETAGLGNTRGQRCCSLQKMLGCSEGEKCSNYHQNP